MVKIIRPLFADHATGKIGNVGSFRQRGNGYQLIHQGQPGKPPTADQSGHRLRFKEARLAWQAIPKTEVIQEGTTKWLILPPWPDFWQQWLIDHPLEPP